MAIDKKIPVSKITVDGEELTLAGREGGADVTEWVKRDVVGTWEAKNFLDSDGVVYDSFEFYFSDHIYEDGHIYVEIFRTLNGQRGRRTANAIVNNTTIVAEGRDSGGSYTYSLNYSIDTGELIADESNPRFKIVPLTIEAMLGFWYHTGLAAYYNFKEDYTVDIINKTTGEIRDTDQFYIEGGSVYVGKDSSFYEYEYNFEEGCLNAGGTPYVLRANPSGTLEITEEGKYFVVPYEKVNVQIDYETILNTEV